jgi:TRAP-type C4-dicarboxylate transport system substrate-binding protein
MGGMAINLDTWNALPADVQNVLDELGAEYSAAEAAEIGIRYERGLQSMQADGAEVYTLPMEEKLKWLNAMPNIAQRWAEATDKRGIPATRVLSAYMDAVRSRGGTPLRQWDREAP